MAHLMSEQKRRESINSGFAALRVALPSAISTDSKAIILRKAVAHITHLEGLLREAGIGYAGPSAREEWVEDEDMDMEEAEAERQEEVKQEGTSGKS
ncbi:MAG: hypothetical protein TREMPRED_002774 [Tremellales sp. Tagirdzhanova-0007]|nr:MAG: hypothetical protein TREMPRED_002774 [Tremellales sp. Tagirdzhanova-0007]